MAIPQNIKDLANKVRTAIYGKDVRESIARSMEITGDTAQTAKNAADTQTARVDSLIKNNLQPSEVVDARTDQSGKTYKLLKERLDVEHSEVKSQIVDLSKQKADQSYVDTMLSTAVNGGPKGIFNTLRDLKNAFPNGTGGSFLVLDIDPEVAHVFIWNGTDWQDAGPYQGIEVPDGSITVEKNAINIGTLINYDENGNVKSVVETDQHGTSRTTSLIYENNIVVSSIQNGGGRTYTEDYEYESGRISSVSASIS